MENKGIEVNNPLERRKALERAKGLTSLYRPYLAKEIAALQREELKQIYGRFGIDWDEVRSGKVYRTIEIEIADGLRQVIQESYDRGVTVIEHLRRVNAAMLLSGYQGSDD